MHLLVPSVFVVPSGADDSGDIRPGYSQAGCHWVLPTVQQDAVPENVLVQASVHFFQLPW